MAAESPVLETAKQAKSLRGRWLTKKGQDILREILRRMRRGDESWIELPKQLTTAKSLRLPDVEVGQQREDMRGVNLDNQVLAGLDFSFADLSFAQIRDADLNKACLQGSKVDYADFSGSNFVGSDLLQIKADFARFDHCNMAGVRLMSASCRGASFHTSALRGADLSHSDFTSADLTSADLRDIGRRKLNLAEIISSSETLGFPFEEDIVRPKIVLKASRKFQAVRNWADFRNVAVHLEPTARVLTSLWASTNNIDAIINDSFLLLASSWVSKDKSVEELLPKVCVMDAMRSIERHRVYSAATEPDIIFLSQGTKSELVAILHLSSVGNVDNKAKEIFKRYYSTSTTMREVATAVGVSEGHVKYELEKIRKVIQQSNEERITNLPDDIEFLTGQTG